MRCLVRRFVSRTAAWRYEQDNVATQLPLLASRLRVLSSNVVVMWFEIVPF